MNKQASTHDGNQDMLIENAEYETQLRLLRDRIAHFTGRHKPVHGGLAAAVQTADTREMSNPAPLLEVRLSFIRNQFENRHREKRYTAA